MNTRNHTAMRLFCYLALLALLTCFAAPALAAGGTPKWTYSPAVAGKQEALATAVDSAGHMIVAGYAVNASYDYSLAKILPDGSGLAWPAKTVDFNGAEDQATAVAVDGNDDIIVTGYVHNGSNFDIHTIKYRGSDGTKLWQHTFNGTGHGQDYPQAIAIDAYNNIYVGGTMQDAAVKDDFVIIKYVPAGPNPDGTPTWSVNYNGPDDGHDRLSAIAVGPGGIAVTGESRNAAGDFDFVVVRFALDNSKAWEKRYLDSGNGMGTDVAVDSQGDVVATGYVDNGTGRNQYTVKYPAADGAAVWAKIRNRGDNDEGRALWLDSADNVYVTGSSYSLTTDKDLVVTRYAAADGAFTAPNGWQTDYNTGNGNVDVGLDITGDNSGDIFVTGTTNYYVGGFDDIYTYKFCKEHGTLLWSTAHGLAAKHDRPVGLGLAPDGHPVMAGWSDTVAGGYDFVAVKYDAGALDAPTALTATTVSASAIALTWLDNSSNEENFVLERRNGTSGVVVTVTLAAGTTSYDDTGLTADHRYYYRVKASNTADGSSAWSNGADARTTVISYAPPTWQHIYTGPSGGDDEPAAIAVGPDNHPVVTGFTFDTEEGYNYYTRKLDRADAATVRWSAKYNDGDNEEDYATAVTVDGSNRVTVSGFASLFYLGGSGNTNDIYTLAYPAGGGAEAWYHQYNGPSGNDDRSSAIANAVDGSDNVVVVGYGKNAALNNDIYVIKYAANGTPQIPLWAATPYNGGGEDEPADVAFDGNGDIFVVGKSWRSGNFDYFVAKYNSGTGTLAWGGAPRFYDGDGHSTDYATALAVDSAGDLYVTGYSVGSSNTGDIVTLKYDGATGNVVPGWPKRYHGGGYDIGVAIGIDLNNNDVVVAGTTFIAASNHDVIVVRYTPAGNEVWTRSLDFTGSDEAAVAMAIDRSGVTCVTAATDSGSGDNIATVLFDYTGLTVGASVFNGAAGRIDYPADVAFNAFGEAFVAGVTTNAANNTDYIVFKVTSTVMQSPTPLTATQLYTEANLAWTDNSLDESGFRIEVKTGACSDAGEWSFVAQTGAGVTGHLASGLNLDSTYCFRVRSFNALGENSRWADVDVVTAPANPPGNLRATVLNTTELLLEWDDLTTGETKFNVQWCAGSGCTFPSDPLVNAVVLLPGSTSHLFTSACEGGTYRFRVNAEKKDYWVSAYAVTPDITMTAKQAPTSLASDWVSEAWAELKWTDNSPDETAFIIERCAGSGCSNFADPVTVNSPAGNVLHFRMDEAAWSSTPNEVVDLSSKGNHGRAYGSATTTSDGKYARAGLFNGTSAYVATPLAIDQAAATSTGATFALWVYPSSTSANNHFVIGTDNGGNDWSLLRNGATWQIANGTDAALVNTGVAVTPNVWQHLVVVFNPATGVTLYKNNVSVWSNAAIAFDASSAPVHLGRRGSLNQEFFDGRLDEAAVFNRPLTVAEVGTLYNHGLRRYNDRTVAHSTVYNYQVKATKTATCPWTSNPSNSHQVTTTPPAPGTLLASASNLNRVNLFWIDTTTTETKFVVERCTGAACSDFSALASPGADAVSFNDDTVCPGSSYRYRVMAVRDGFWDSAYSNVADVTTPALTTPVVTLGTVSEEQVNLLWPFATADLTGYKVSRCQGDATFCADDGNYLPRLTKTVLPAGAVMMMPMDEPQWRGTPAEVSDITGSGNHGQTFGGVTTIAGGITQRGGSFDGIDDYITTQLNINQGTGATGVTFEAWVYPTSTNGTQYVISTDNGGADWGFGNNWGTWGVVNGNGWYASAPAIPVTVNTWQHLVVTFQIGGNVTIYKNGNQGVYTVAAIGTDDSDANVTIGRQGSLNAGYFAGRIDNAVVYDRVLTPAEILARYQSYSHSETALPSDTEFHYRVWPYKTACSTEGPYASVMAKTLKPPAPINLTLTKVSTTRVDLGWTDLATSETGYRLQWCAGAGCTFDPDPTVNSVTLGVNAQSYIDTTVCQGETYRYQIRAEKDWVNATTYTWVSDWTVGSVTMAAKAATDNFTATTLSESQIALAWSDGNGDEDGYLLQKCLYNDAASCQITDDAAFAPMASSILPALWFKMDEASWGTPVNSAAGGNNATKYGDAVPVNDAGRGQVGTFDGVGDYLGVAHYARINPTKAITVSVWAKSTGATWNSDLSFLSKRDAYILGPVLGTGNMRFYIFRSGDNWREITVTPGVDITQWHLYTGVYDGTDIILYVDGVERGRANWPGTINADTGVLEIGRDEGQTANNRNLAGRLDNALIFDQVLSPAEILSLYNNQLILATNHLESGLASGTEYFYRLRASKAATCSWPVNWTLKSATTIAPPAPTNLKVTTINTTQVDLTWTDNSGSETGYRVQRCEGTGCSFADVPTAGDSVLLAPNAQAYSDTTVKEGTSYSFRVRAEKDGSWTTAWLGPLSATTVAKLAPGNLVATRVSEARIDLTWDDSNNDETGFKVERCAGAGCSDFAEIATVAGNGAEATNLVASGTLATGNFSPYATNVTHPTTGATVRVLAIPNTGTAVASNSAAMTTLKTNTNYIVTFEAWCSAGADINLQNDLIPDTLPEFALTVSPVPKTFRVVFNSSHADMLGATNLRFFHYNVGRTIYVTNIKMTPPTRVTYTDTDSGLLPDTSYSYRVNTYKTATVGVNNWLAGPTNIATAATSVVAPSGLVAAALDTTTVKLTWNDNTNTETGTEIWRCQGSGCNDFAKVGEAAPNAITFTDVKAAENTDYRYQVIVKNEGLSASGGGTWSHYAPVVISPFTANAYYQVTVNYNGNMRGDYGDLRFYDETAQRQLAYWIKSYNASSATVWFMARGNNTINMYYGNPAATDAGNKADFIDEYTFSGTVIDASRWLEIDSVNAISQNDGLVLKTTADYSYAKALISQKIYNRYNGWELYADLTINADTNGSTSDIFILGWWLNQTATVNYNQFVHGFTWYNYQLRPYEKGSLGYFGSYTANTHYEIKVVLTAAGAQYYIRGGAFPSWTLLSTLNTYTDQSMRIAVNQYSHNATIRSITMTPTPIVATLGSANTNARTSFGYPWSGLSSNIADVKTPPAKAPYNLSVAAVSDTQISLSWSDDNVAETGFLIERCLDGGACTVFDPPGSGTSHLDTGLEASKLYTYRVRAYKDAYHSWIGPFSDPVSGKTFPQPATGLNAEPLTRKMIKLTWVDEATDEDGYEIEVQIWNGRFIKTGEVGANVTTYIDKVGIEPETLYTYRVRPFRGTGKSPYSNEATAKTTLALGGDTCVGP